MLLIAAILARKLHTINLWSSIHTEDDIEAQHEMIFLSHYAEKQGGGEGSRQVADFVGRMYGYLTGPLGRPQKELEQEVFRRLAPEDKPLFEAGRKEVSDRFAVIEVKLKAARETAKTKERKLRGEQMADLEEETASLSKQIRSLEKHVKELRGEAKK